jgi:hypothetical protein
MIQDNPNAQELRLSFQIRERLSEEHPRREREGMRD